MSKPRTRIEKGKRAEKQVCELIELAGLGKARREAGSGNGKNKGDIFCNLPFLLEVKNQKTIHFTDWVEQAKAQARIGNKIPLGTSKMSGGEFAEYCSRARMWANKELGIYIPEPYEGLQE